MSATPGIHHSYPRRTTRPSGVALLMVLTVVAAASLLAWAMLASATMRSQVDDNAVDALEAVSLAESGTSYAMHCLRYPAKVRPALADATTWFYPGELGFKPWSDARGTVDIVVTNIGTNKYKIRSTAAVTRASNLSAARHTIEAEVTVQLQGILTAAGFNGGLTIPTNMTISGPVTASGDIPNFSAQVTNSPALVVAADNVVPPASQVALLLETGTASVATGATANDRTYTYNGVTYIAEKAPTSITVLGLTTLRPSVNPLNVWYSDSNVTLNSATFNGVLVLRGTAVLGVAGTCNVTGPADMPAIVVNNNIDLKSTLVTNAKLYVTGAVWLGGKFTALSNNKPTAVINIDGALLMGNTTPKVEVAAGVTVAYKSSAVGSVKKLSTVPTISGVAIDRWRSME